MTRRSMLRGALATAGTTAAAVATGQSAQAAGPRRPTAFVFIPGSNSPGAVWNDIAGELTARGHYTFPVDLPGHGQEAWFPQSYQAPQDLAQLATERSPLADITPADNVARVVSVVRRAARFGRVVLVGQSLGGVTVTGVANAVPHLLSRLVYISAFCCVKLPSVIACYETPEGKDSLVLAVPKAGDPATLGTLRTNWRSADPKFIALAKEAFLAHGSDQRLYAILNISEPDDAASVVFTDTSADIASWGRVPRTFVRLSEDRAIPPALQDRMIREADEATPHNRFRILSLPMDHLGFFDHPELMAEILESQ